MTHYKSKTPPTVPSGLYCMASSEVYFQFLDYTHIHTMLHVLQELHVQYMYTGSYTYYRMNTGVHVVALHYRCFHKQGKDNVYQLSPC